MAGRWPSVSQLSLNSVSHHHFDLANEFDISRYFDILADVAIVEANSSLQGSKAPSVGRLSKEISHTSFDVSGSRSR